MSTTYAAIDRALPGRNRTLIVVCLLFSLQLLSSCRKDAAEGNPATLQVFNAMDDGLRVYTNLSGKHPVNYNASLLIPNKFYMSSATLNNNLLSIATLPQRIDFYVMPDTLPKDKPVLTVDITGNTGDIYSLFLFGSKLSPAYALFKDYIPAIKRNDSTTNLRFANFSETKAISINLQGKANGSFIENLPFKTRSDFMELKADVSVNNYVFEIRDQETGVLLTTFTTTGLNPATAIPSLPNEWIFKSNTLVYTGKAGAVSPNQPRISKMNHR